MKNKITKLIIVFALTLNAAIGTCLPCQRPVNLYTLRPLSGALSNTRGLLPDQMKAIEQVATAFARSVFKNPSIHARISKPDALNVTTDFEVVLSLIHSETDGYQMHSRVNTLARRIVECMDEQSLFSTYSFRIEGVVDGFYEDSQVYTVLIVCKNGSEALLAGNSDFTMNVKVLVRSDIGEDEAVDSHFKASSSGTAITDPTIWNGFNLRISPSSYNPNGRTDRIIRYIEESKYSLHGKRVLIPGAGVGKLAIYAASKGAHVVAIEIHKPSCEDMRYNVEQAGFSESVEIIEGVFPVIPEELGNFDYLISHPPIFDRHYARGSHSVVDDNFSFILGITMRATERLNIGGRIIILYPSKETAINETCPEEDMYLFNLEQERDSLRQRGFELVDMFPGDTENESTIWEIVNTRTATKSLPSATEFHLPQPTQAMDLLSAA